LKPLRGLIVEDSDDDCALLVRTLRRSGYEVSHRRVQTPDAMRKALADQVWDIVFADWTLPSFSALEALAVLWDSGIYVPLIIVSGTVEEATAAGAVRAGADAFLLKGSTVDLCAAVERLIRAAALRADAKRDDHPTD
jgi:DNA-binding response OmpR family regulator